MRVVALVLCAILVSSAASKFSAETICPENYKVMAEELKKAIDSPKTLLEDKRAAVKKLFALLADCAKEFIQNKVAPPMLSFPASPAQCATMRSKLEDMNRRLKEKYNFFLSIEATELNFRIKRDCK